MPTSPLEATAPPTSAQNATSEQTDGYTTPTMPSPVLPPVSPSISLHSLGMSPLSSLRRQFTTPYVMPPSSHESSASASEDQDRAQDSTDVLVQRLNDLAARISSTKGMRDEDVGSLHAKVDELEKALSSRNVKGTRRQRHHLLSVDSHRGDLDVFAGPPSPGWIRSHLAEMTLALPSSPGPQESTEVAGTADPAETRHRATASEFAQQALAEAQKLEDDLAKTVSGLQGRLEEQNVGRATWASCHHRG